MNIEKALRESTLTNARDASAALRDGWTLVIHPRGVPGSQMLTIYKGRYEHLKKKRGAHAAQLAASVGEFVESLGARPSATVISANLTGDQEHCYSLFLLDGADVVLGCMRTVSKTTVTPERWSALWEDID